MVKGLEGCEEAFGTPGFQRLEEEAGKGLDLGIGDVVARCSMLLKGFWHSGNLGDMAGIDHGQRTGRV